jgi:RND family efflux transporter MFP subunit
MMRRYCWLLGLAVAIGLLGSMAPARDDDNDVKRAIKVGKKAGPESNGKVAKPATVKVEKGTIKVEVSLKGIVEAEQMAELSIKPEAWSMPLTVKKAVEHGTPVKKGDVLVEVDPEKIDRAIRELQMERELADLSLQQAQEELPVLEKMLPLDLASAERFKKHADEDLEHFLKVDRPLSEEAAENSVKSSTWSLENAKEELKQLQKMYRNKDLTEETEEIILKRQRHMVEMAEFFLKSSKIRRDQTLKVDLPRREQTMRDSAVKQAYALDKTKNLLKLTLSQKKLALNKLRYEHGKSEERLANLKKDRELFTVRAPADGIAYHGKCSRGQWTTAMGMQKLQAGGTISPNDVFLTIVSPRPVFVRATVDEKDLHLLRPNLKGKVVPAGYPDLKLPARLVKVSSVPLSAGSFDARLAIEADKGAEALMPGMACTVKLTAYRNNSALTVPSSAVFTDDADEDVRYVYVADEKGGKLEKRTVKIGKTVGSKAEVLDGLREGDEILAAKPGEKSLVGSSIQPAGQEK